MSQVNSLISKFENISHQDTTLTNSQRVHIKRYSMPLRQSTLAFKPTPASSNSVRAFSDSVKISHAPMPTPPAEEDSDTIVVKPTSSSPRPDLLTPSDTASNVSPESGSYLHAKKLPKSRSKRVNKAQKSDSKETLVEDEEMVDSESKARCVSGDTLVADPSASQTSLLKSGIDALNMTWNMDNVFTSKDENQLLDDDQMDAEQGSTITVNEDGETSEDEAVRAERLAARQAKMAQNAKAWEKRRKAAEKNATRRSSRASLLMSKAGAVVSGMASTVMGKKAETKGNDRKRSSEPTEDTQYEEVSEPDMKKRKTGDKETLAAAAQAIRSRAPKDKKWLVSGLYAGQNRTFNPSLSGSKNKRKSEIAESLMKENKVLPLPMFAGERLLQGGRDFKLPFDVFSPLPTGQPKPDEWKKVNKNVFIGDSAAEWRTSKFLEESTCLCTTTNGCDQNCMNRYMYYECDDKNCNLTEDQCGNRAFEGLKARVKKGGKYNVGVEVIKTKDRGYGVRSNRTFEPNQIILEYTGEIITQEECETRMRTMYKDNECYYLMLFDQNMIIDATRGSMARFVNHSCEPNCRMEKWTVGGKPRMALFAGDRGVMTGEELTYDYNFDPYSQKNVQECRCGAGNCRGILGPRPKEVKRISPDAVPGDKAKGKKEGKLAGAKRKFAEVLEESTNRLNKKRKTDDSSLKSSKKTGSPRTKNRPSTVVVKKSIGRKVSIPKKTSAAAAIARRPSQLKKILAEAKNKTAAQRVVSTSSVASGKALLRKTQDGAKATVSRSSSLKEKAASMGKSVARSVRGK